MNRRILLTVLALAAVLLATPYIGMVQAGKGQTKQEFLFHLDGSEVPFSADRWILTGPDVPNSFTTVHVFGSEFAGAFYVEIGPGGTVETIGNAFLDYDCELKWTWIANTDGLVVQVREVISIYDSDVLHDATTLRGTLELQALGQGQSSFVGFGTGEFEGVKIAGNTEYIVPNMVMNRVGTVMGWPT